VENRTAGAVTAPLPAERVFSLVATLLDARRPLTKDEILDRLRELYVPHGSGEPEPETLRKRFERDKKLVKEMGFPLVSVEGGQPGGEDLDDGVVGYRIDEGALRAPEIRLTDTQRLLLLGVVETLLDSDDFPLRDDLAMAVHKMLMASGAGSAVGGVDTCRLVLGTGRGDVASIDRRLVETSLEALRTRRSLSILYRSSGGEVTRRVVDPYGLSRSEDRWMLTGHCHLRSARRTFSLHRVIDMQPAGDGDGPDFEPPEDFELEAVASKVPWQYEVHDPVPVILEADEDFAWHAESLLGTEPSGRGQQGVRWELEVLNVDHVLELVLMYGPRLRVREPADLRRRVVDAAHSLGDGNGRDDVPAITWDGEEPRRRPAVRDDSARRLRRFTFLVSYLSRREEADLSELSRVLGTGEASVLSDIERLSLCGVYPSTDFLLFDIFIDEERGRVRLHRNPVPLLERPARLTEREVVALLLGLKIVRDGFAPPFDWEADHVMDAVLEAAGEDLTAAVGEIERRVRLSSRHDLGWETFYEVSSAVAERRRLEIEYYTQGRDSLGTRIVHPYVLVTMAGRWYLIAHCEWRGDVRTFRLDRIRRARSVQGAFDPPAEFDPSRHLGTGIFPDPDAPEQERVVIAVPRVRGEERMVFAVPSDRYEGFITWLLTHVRGFRIEHPPALGAALEARRKRIVRAHEMDSGGASV